MKPRNFFLAGMAQALFIGWRAKMKYPFAFPVKAIGRDWENIGNDLTRAITQLEVEKKNEAS